MRHGAGVVALIQAGWLRPWGFGVLFALSGLAACQDHGASLCVTDTGGDGGTDGGADGGVNDNKKQFDQFVVDLAGAACKWQFNCCSLPQIDLLGTSAYLTETDCQWYTELLLRDRLLDVRAAVAVGRISMAPELAKACLESFATGGCAGPTQDVDPWVLLSSCRDPFVGRVAAGERCFVSNECTTGSQCVNAASFNTGMIPLTPQGVSAARTVAGIAPLVGTCLPYLEKGERCRSSEECAPMLYCRRPAYVCAAPSGPGETCKIEMDQNGELRDAILCDDATQNLVCGTGMCRRLPRDGEPCFQESFFLCDPDPVLALSCVGQGFNGPGVCKTAGPLGAACGSDGLPPCAFGLACLAPDDNQIGTCGQPPSNGERCPVDGRCVSPAVCNFLNQTCMVPGKVRDGDACMVDNDCVSLTCATEGNGLPGFCVLPETDLVCRGPGSGSFVSGGTVVLPP